MPDSKTAAGDRINLGSAATIPDIAPALERLQKARRMNKEELRSLLQLAREHGGELVDVTRNAGSDDDWCGTMWFRGPRPKKLGTLLEGLIGRGYGLRVFPRGIINPDALQITIQNQPGLG
jgi:hypothetical protein